MSKHWTIHVEAATDPISNLSGYAVLCESPNGDPAQQEAKRFLTHTPIHVAEIAAATKGLMWAPVGADVILQSSSQHLILSMSEWRAVWERRQWRSSKGEPVAHQEDWKLLFAQVDLRHVRAQWIKKPKTDPVCTRVKEMAQRVLNANNTEDLK